MDLIDLGHGRDETYRYILTYIELLTRHVWLFPLKSKCAVEVARSVSFKTLCQTEPGGKLTPSSHPCAQLYFIWSMTQVPGRLQSDNGTEFCNKHVDQLCKAYGVDTIHGAVGRPQSQGCVERCNKTVKDKIAAQLMVAPTGLSWVFQVCI